MTRVGGLRAIRR